MSNKEKILDLYYNQHLKQNKIAEIVGTTTQYVSKVVRADKRNKQEKEKRKKEELAGIVKDIFRNRKRISYTDLVIELVQTMDIKERTAKSYISYMKNNGMLNQDYSNNYTL